MVSQQPSSTIGWNVTPSSSLLEENCDTNISKICTTLGKDGYNYIAYPIGGFERAKYKFPNGPDVQIKDIPPINLPDSQIHQYLWKNYITGKTSSWIDTDNEDPNHSKISMNALRMELRHAAYLGLQDVIIPIKRVEYDNLIKVIYHCLWVECLDIKVILLFPTNKTFLINHQKLNDTNLINHWINLRRSIKNYSTEKVTVGIKLLGNQMDSEFTNPDCYPRWRGEPLNLFALNTEIFNDASSMILTQATIGGLLYNQKFLIMCENKCESVLRKHFAETLSPLISNIVTQRQLPTASDWDFSLHDKLTLPSIPSWKDLTSFDYQNMEADKLKYKLYAEALLKVIHQQLIDFDENVVVYILGAGRSGLVQICMDVVKGSVPETIRNRVHLIAIEKNPHAVLSLTYYNQILWHSKVKIIEGGIHHVLKDETIPKADIIVTELLGSFGDNSLAPECWKSALTIIKETTEFIPSKFETFLAPICATKLRDQLRDSMVSVFEEKRAVNAKFDKETGEFKYWRPKTWYDHFYVVSMKRFFAPAQPQHLSQFICPSFNEECNNERHNIIKYDIGPACEIDGFVGYMAAVLAKDVFVSNSPYFRKGKYTCPKSWLPCYIPLREGIHVKNDSEVLFYFWRKVSDEGVWYEWKVEYTDFNTGKRETTELQNENGESYFMSMPPNPDEIKSYI
jgi:protein arginine N-methyltransferase 5